MPTALQQRRELLKNKKQGIVRSKTKRRKVASFGAKRIGGHGTASYWEYDNIHPYDVDSNGPWCNRPMALLFTGIVIFGSILIVIAGVGRSNDKDYSDYHGRDSDEVMSDYARMVNTLQRGLDEEEYRIECPIGSHAWHPKGSNEEPTCRVNFPWPVAVDDDIIHPGQFDSSLKNEHDPCTSFDAYVCHGWHLSDADKGAVGDRSNLPPSRGFSELGYRNMHLNMKTSMSDVSFMDTTWDRSDASQQTYKRHGTLKQKENSRNLDPQMDNRAYFHEMVTSCSKSLSGTYDDLHLFEQRMKDLLDVKGSDLAGLRVENMPQATLGFMFGRAQCYGAAPVLYATADLDIKNKERELLNVEPSGVLGVRSVLLDSKADKYKKKHVVMISLACRVLVDLNVLKNVNVCTSDALAVENMLVWDWVNENATARKGETLFKPVSTASATPYGKKPTTDNEDLPIVDLVRPDLFTTDWWKAYEYGLVVGGCIGEESLEAVQQAPVWTYSLEYVENLGRILEKGPAACTVKQWKNFLRVALTLDYLEHANIEVSTTKDKGEKGANNWVQGPLRNITRPWQVRDIHKRGHHLHITDRHFGPSSLSGATHLKSVFASYANAILHKKKRGTISNADKSTWDLSHYVTVDPSTTAERHLMYFYQCSAIGNVYLPGIADDTFAAVLTSTEERNHIYDVTNNIVEAIIESIQESTILTDTAKGDLTRKARAISVRVAVPWHGHEQPSYASAGIEGKSFYLDTVQVRSWHTRNDFDRIFSPNSIRSRKDADPTQRDGSNVQYHFGMSTSAVNAYYSPEENSINILAGILGAPFYDAKYNDASLYATIGAVIGHELSHGFDSTGVKFDPKGSYRHWMSQEDESAYEGREQCFIDRYTRMTRLGNVNNGASTITENIADTMGLRAALRAFLAQGHPKDMKVAMKGFVEAYGQAWCNNQTPESERGQIYRDPHSPANVRVDGAITSLRTPDGRSPLTIAYKCPADSPMTREEPCTLW